MITYFNIINGPLKGFRFRARAGITLGGPESHIDLKDPTIIGIHSRIVSDNHQQLFIEPEKRTHLIYVNSQRVQKALLQTDQQIRIGKTTFVVTTKLPEPKVDVEGNTDQWLEVIKKKYQEFSQLPKEKPINLTVMNPIINLHFIRGLQVQTDWTLGYGPRIIGPESTDLKIFEPKAPGVCFELIPASNGVLFQTNFEKIVKMNDQNIRAKVLDDNDKITIFKTEILVSVIL